MCYFNQKIFQSLAKLFFFLFIVHYKTWRKTSFSLNQTLKMYFSLNNKWTHRKSSTLLLVFTLMCHIITVMNGWTMAGVERCKNDARNNNSTIFRPNTPGIFIFAWWFMYYIITYLVRPRCCWITSKST